MIVRLKREYPGWGAPKIREKLRQQFTGPHLPAISTVHAVLDRYHLVQHRRGRRARATGTELSRPTAPNALWCADYKGEFMLGNRRYCYPSCLHGHSASSGASCRHCGGLSHVGGRPRCPRGVERRERKADDHPMTTTTA